ncbi:hypothetical protein PGT21_019388 [Puccinia graminis f. sp. tritici]|uniref:Small ribosomal subunit protein mS41 n=1 Tax=Puccinia graminis f. sp. tritici TaxID=56615 RepID=A0A5B0QIK4_PUCGR|nr:hypothetical protein PGT21_019388 [Puccinia graminis f. sp. tritici]
MFRSRLLLNQLNLNLNRTTTASYYSTATTTTTAAAAATATATTKQTTSKPTQQTPKFARFVHKPSPPRIPKPHHGIETVEAFLESLRRPSLLSLTNKFTEWDQLFSLEPKTDLVKDGTLSVPKERRYLLRSMELFRQGLDPKEFAVGVRKPKKFRGWGPRVQHGKRLRGRPAGRMTI